LTHPAAAERPELARPSVLAEMPAATAIPRDTRDVVVVPKIETTVVSRGDNLWRISRLTYGKGIRYSIIFDANRDQIRDPDLIYPGQIFVLPQAFDSEK
jgi:nucleoid-associated protein YgaU